MDTMEITKISGWLIASLLVLMLLNWGSETIYHVGSSGHGDEEEHVSGYPIEVEVASTDASEDAGPTVAELMATADVGKGEKVFSKCKACHKLENGANGTGPHLFAVVDRAIGSEAGFAYSPALAGVGGNWDIPALDGFLLNPKEWAPGTKMSFRGLRKAEDRANLIAYLQTIN